MRDKTKHFCSRGCVNKGRTHTEEWKQAMSERNTGEGNPFYGRQHNDKTLDQLSTASKNAALRMTIPQKKARCAKISQSMTGVNNPFHGRHHTAESRTAMSKTRSRLISEGKLRSGPRGRSGTHTSSKTGRAERYDSFFELLRMRVLDVDTDVIDWTKAHGITIEYQLDDVTRRYVPDFRVVRAVGVTLEEIKGYEDAVKLDAKMAALRSYCLSNGLCAVYLDVGAMTLMAQQWFGESLTVLRKKEFEPCQSRS